MLIRTYRAEDVHQIVELFRRSVRELASRDYTPEQIAAWAPETPEPPAWSSRLTSGLVIVGEIEARIAGFARLEANGHLDLLYVHPDFKRRGVASKLCEVLEGRARRNGISRLFTESSISAKPFFERRGFRLTREQEAFSQGVKMPNFCMERML